MATTTKLVLIRHGESQAQVDGLLVSHDTCRGLSPQGRLQAEALRDRLTATGELGTVDASYTSLLPRAIETAGIVSARGNAPQAAQECAWCELHPGSAEGLTWDELREQHPINGDPDDLYRPRVAGAETWAAFFQRVRDRLERVLQEHRGQQVVVFGHGGIVGASLVAFGEVPIEQGVPVVRKVANTSITEWHHTGTAWQLVRFNDTKHMTGVGR